MGYIVGHESQVRILIENFSKGLRKVSVEKAVDLPNNYCNVIMTQYGMLDPKIIKEKGLKVPEKAQEVLITPEKKEVKEKKKAEPKNVSMKEPTENQEVSRDEKILTPEELSIEETAKKAKSKKSKKKSKK